VTPRTPSVGKGDPPPAPILAQTQAPPALRPTSSIRLEKNHGNGDDLAWDDATEYYNVSRERWRDYITKVFQLLTLQAADESSVSALVGYRVINE